MEDKKVEQVEQVEKVEEKTEAVSLPSASDTVSKAEVNVKDLKKLNDTLTKRIEEIEKKMTPKKEVKKTVKETPKTQHVPSLEKTETPKTETNKNVYNGIYIG